MKRFFTFFFLFLSLGFIRAQIPTTCLEVESILVDACGSPEGENEMVRFQVGNIPLNLAAMTVSWPNGSWLGLCQNATTANVVNTWNSTITECGLLLEPIGGIIPAGERVIMVTSTNVIPGANSFAGLSDTIYVIFQCSGNTAGHFANYGTGLRTLTITVGACNEIVTYDRALLEDPFGVNTAADGATVTFDWPGNPDYINIGCTAPVSPLVVNAGSNQTGFCVGDTVVLSASTQGSFSSYLWTGGTGTFTNPTSSNTNYIVGAGDTNPLNLYFTATNCNGRITDTIQIFLSSPAPVSITPTGPVYFCTGDSVQLTAIGSGPFLWNTTETTSTIYASLQGTYIVSQNTTCGTTVDTVLVILSGTPPAASIIPSGSTVLCPGNNVTLTASGGTGYQWSTSATTPAIVAMLPGNYSVVVTSACGSDTAFITLTTNTNPQANISPSSPISLCTGNVDVTVTGTGTFAWSTGGTGSTENFNTAGNYYVVASNTCGTDTAFFTIINSGLSASFNATPVSGPSPLDVNFTNTSVGATAYNWIFGDGNTDNTINPNHTYTTPGIYTCTLIASNAGGCSDTASIIITVDSCLYLIKIPNIFTPDGNSVNDNYIVTVTCADQFNAYIFDRWGVKVYEYFDPSANWDGTTFTGSKVSQGVYSYVIFIKDYNGDEHSYSGFIHVFEN